MSERVVRDERSDVAEFGSPQTSETFAVREHNRKISATLMEDPAGTPTGFTPSNFPPANSMRVPGLLLECASQAAGARWPQWMAKPHHENPSVAIESRSSAVRSFEVAWRSKASSESSWFMPEPSSKTRIMRLPPDSASTRIERAPASSAFSSSSFYNRGRPFDKLRPPQFLLATFSGNMRIRDIPQNLESLNHR